MTTQRFAKTASVGARAAAAIFKQAGAGDPNTYLIMRANSPERAEYHVLSKSKLIKHIQGRVYLRSRIIVAEIGNKEYAICLEYFRIPAGNAI